MSRSQTICEAWLRNKAITPRTGRSITEGGPTYLALEAVLCC